MKVIPLSTDGYVALVDEAYYPVLAKNSWYAIFSRSKHGLNVYAGREERSSGKRRCILMHHVVLPGVGRVDHADGNGLNNQRYNLRPATRSQNRINSAKRHGTSRFRGVSIHKSTGKWQVKIKKDGREHHIGLFTEEVDAATAWNLVAFELFGEFARMNAPARLRELGIEVSE